MHEYNHVRLQSGEFILISSWQSILSYVFLTLYFLYFWLQIVLDDLNNQFMNSKISTLCYQS